MWYKSVFVFYLLIISFNSKAQSIGEPKNNYLLKKAKRYYNNSDYNKAIGFIEKYQHTQKGKNDTLVLVTLGDCYWKLKFYNEAYQCYQVLSFKKNFELTATIRFRMAEYLASQQDYIRAKDLLSGLSEFKEKADGFELTNIMLRDSLDYTIKSLKINTKAYREFAPTVIGSRLYFSTNQPENLIIPKVSAIDGSQFFHLKQLFDTSASTVFLNTTGIDKSIKNDTLNSKKKRQKVALSFEGSDVQLLTRANRSNEDKRYKNVNNDIRNYTQPVFGLSSYQFYNVANFSYASSTNKVYFTVNQKNLIPSAKHTPNIFSLRIAEAELHDLTLTNIKILPLHIDSTYSVMHPAIHPNGRFIVFSSNQINTHFDLYYSIKDSSGWSKPKSLEELNTIGDEVFPSFTPDGNFYFSSNGRAGLGGQDIYSVNLGLLGGDNKIEHLSYPINSSYDDFGITYNLSDSETAYFSSDRNGSDDIFLFEKKSINININGTVLNNSTKLRKKDVTVYLSEEIGNGKFSIIDSMVTDITGNYHFISKPNRKYTISFKDSIQISNNLLVNNFGNILDKELPSVSLTNNEIPNNNNFSASINNDTAKYDDSRRLTTYLLENKIDNNIENKSNIDTLKKFDKKSKGLKINTDSTIENSAETSNSKFIVYYDLNKSILTSKDYFILDSLLSVLKKDSKLNVVIGSFTDCIGSMNYNMMLSNKRSKATIEYLLAHGLDMSRIRESHYGESYLDVTCFPNNYQASQQLLNRRTEIYLTKEIKSTWLDLHNNSPKNISIVSKYNRTFIDDSKTAINPINKIFEKNKLEKEVIQKRNDSILLIKNNLLLTEQINAINDSIKLKLIKDSLFATKHLNESPTTATKFANKQIDRKKKERETDSVNNVIRKKDSAYFEESTKLKNYNKQQALLKKQILKNRLDSISVVQKINDSLLNLSILRNKIIESSKKIRIQDSIKRSIKIRDSIVNSMDLVKRQFAQKKNKQNLDSINQTYKMTDTVIPLPKESKISKKKNDALKKQDLLQIEKYQDTLLHSLLIKDSLHQLSLIKNPENSIEKTVVTDVRNLISYMDTINQQEINTMVSYLTNRINKKPIEVYVNSENVTVDLYDNGVHDKDSISIIYNKKFVVYKNELRIDKPIHFKLKVSQDNSKNTLIMVAENLGTEPPNTAAMFITDDTGKKQIVYLTTDLTHNEVVYFIRMNKK